VRAFRFRAQAALDLRRREDEQAQRALAHAEARVQAAILELREAQRRVEQARRECADAIGQADAFAQLIWHRSWIVRLEQQRNTAAGALAARQQEQARAAAARQQTRVRVESLERFKDKAQRAWADHAAAAERKHLDALATIRFVTAARTGANG
jgi:flagellar export protein FliJ